MDNIIELKIDGKEMAKALLGESCEIVSKPVVTLTKVKENGTTVTVDIPKATYDILREEFDLP